MRAIIINPGNQSITEVEITIHAGVLQEAVGGSIETAHEFDNGDILYVDGEGLLKADDAMVGQESSDKAFFFDIGAHQPFAGRGIIVGREDEDGRITNALTSLNEIAARISFLVPKLVVDADKGTMH